MFLPQLPSLNLVPSAHVSGKGTGQVFWGAMASPCLVPRHICALSSLCLRSCCWCCSWRQGSIVRALGTVRHVGRQGPATWELCSSLLCLGGRTWSDSWPQPNFPCLCSRLSPSSSQEPEAHLRQHLKSIPMSPLQSPPLPPVLHCQQ